jgi:hypothetical protein
MLATDLEQSEILTSTTAADYSLPPVLAHFGKAGGRKSPRLKQLIKIAYISFIVLWAWKIRRNLRVLHPVFFFS